MSALAVIVSGTMLAETVRMTIPYACAGLGGVLSERSGVVNIALEGSLLSSALAAVAIEWSNRSRSAERSAVTWARSSWARVRSSSVRSTTIEIHQRGSPASSRNNALVTRTGTP